MEKSPGGESLIPFDNVEECLGRVIIKRLLIDGIGPRAFLEPYTYAAALNEMIEMMDEIAYSEGYPYSNRSSEEDVSEAKSLGIKIFEKPFKLAQIINWLDQIEKDTDQKRKLSDWFLKRIPQISEE